MVTVVPCPGTDWMRAELHVWRHADARVGHRDGDIVARHYVSRRRRAGVKAAIGGGQFQPATTGSFLAPGGLAWGTIDANVRFWGWRAPSG